jgi:hypothetical protein
VTGNRVRRGALALVAGGAALVAGSLAATSTANAAVVEDCKTVVSTLVDRPDNGHGTPSKWALDDFTRTVKVCHVPNELPTLADDVAKTLVEVESWHYHATVTDEGTFTTVNGFHRSPNNGHMLLGNVPGTLKGGFTADVEAPASWQFFTPDTLNGKTFTGEAGTEEGGPTTSTWVKALWSDGLSKQSSFINKDWWWKYKTCNEYWLDSEKTDDGQNQFAGDITGYSRFACPRVVFTDNCDGTTKVTVYNDAPFHKAVLKFKLSTDALVREINGGSSVNIVVDTDDVVKVETFFHHWKKLAEHTWTEPKGCETPTPTPSTTTASPTPTPTLSTSPSVTVTVTTSPPVAAPQGNNDDLPVTGSALTVPLLGGGILVALGAGLIALLYFRNKREEEAIAQVQDIV